MKNKSIQLINRTTNGKVFKCSKCTNIHLEYKNLSFNFTKDEYVKFKNYFLTIDGEYWENLNKNSFYDRKIMIPIGHKNFMISMNSVEVYELKALFSEKKQHEKRVDLSSFNILNAISVN